MLFSSERRDSSPVAVESPLKGSLYDVDVAEVSVSEDGAISSSDSESISTDQKPEVTKAGDLVDVSVLRAQIPAHCFKPLWRWTVWYTIQDFTLITGSAALAMRYIPMIDDWRLRWVAWIIYGFAQGNFMTGLWVLGHECGHGAFSTSERVNNLLGLVFHSVLLTPYYGWRATHRRHHAHHNHLSRDNSWVPPERDEYLDSLLFNSERVRELFEDMPAIVLVRFLMQQALGFHYHMLTSVTVGPRGTIKPTKELRASIAEKNHYNPNAAIFRESEWGSIVVSDIGIAMVLAALAWAGPIVGWSTLALLYVQPLLWLNNWLVAITFLHHAHPQAPKFQDEAWTFIKGATGTVDRNFGRWISRFIWHDIIDFHVIHHIFPRIPFYYGEEATRAVHDLLGKHYLEDKQSSYLKAMWTCFTECKWVEVDDASLDPKRQEWFYRH